ncbi:NAD(P)-binding domain-containing protein [Rhizobium leguminosarum]|uniref:3-hydroxyisobutyrate dehydrogenase-related beta-hydroxyacid dehydrogenase n=3 Tax=Rhizobium leguminosarum TaxID=384 RepID=A0A0U2YV50_RHILV|nr:NAD(P)-binding domain-containing protein [Rhizobium leguminosarum]ALU64553.1 3-hydroxyisobutyrate dehydrogenase-related beta-hydroxyacid dehydrogenase [Rhizobium leguminosarum bv. viciae]KZB02846.1 hypothetical protein A4A59_08230 [Rhizobium leguminosarum]
MIGFIGLGEVVRAMAAGIREKTGENVVALYRPTISQRNFEDAREAGIDVVTNAEELAARASVIFSAVTPMTAGEVCRNVAPHLTSEHLYVDCNSVTMQQKIENARFAEASEADFVDAALFGVVAELRQATPIIASGRHAARLMPISKHYGMNVRIAGPEVGQASAIKMLRSVIFKGMAALFIESLTVSQKIGVSNQVIDTIQETYPDLQWKEFIQIFISRTILHAGRRAEELGNCAQTLQEVGGYADMSLAGVTALQRLAGYNLETAIGVRDQDLDSILSILSDAYFQKPINRTG